MYPAVMQSSLPSPGSSIAPSELQSRAMPRCNACGHADVRRSHSLRFLDGVAGTLGFKPFRCRGCRARFFAKPL